jgi:transposase-like protein
VPHRKWTRLSEDARSDVATRYAAGATTTELAREYGVVKSTIIGILRSKAVVMRRQALNTEQVSEAARLYESGLSLSQAANRLDVNQETMRMAIIATGVHLRPPTGIDSSRQ